MLNLIKHDILNIHFLRAIKSSLRSGAADDWIVLCLRVKVNACDFGKKKKRYNQVNMHAFLFYTAGTKTEHTHISEGKPHVIHQDELK